MLICPFCNSEVGTVVLREGRCPSCGGVLYWDDDNVDEASDVPIEERPSLAELPAEFERGQFQGADWEADEKTIKATSASLSPKPPVPALTPSPPPPSPPVPVQENKATVADKKVLRPEKPPGEEKENVDKVWGDAIASPLAPMMTIRAADTGTGTVNNLFIHPRVVKPAGEFELEKVDYELMEVIGQGGVGVVWAARQASVDRTVALKMLKAEFADNREHRNKFMSEAVVTGDLDHPNIVPIYDLGSNAAGAYFYSMKRVVGVPWSKVIGQRSVTENLEILMNVADAVAFAHARGVVHRDLKPENVMLGDFGEVLVMDWGISLSLPNFIKQGRITQSTSMGGTPAYMAPEMATGPLEIIGQASDVYLLGAILFEIIVGKPPHHGKDVMTCLYAAARNEIQPTDKSGELLNIAYRAMATAIEDRHGSVQEFQKSIREYQSHSESIVLSARADQDLAKARQTRDYLDYSRALFGFQESLGLWSGNERAKDGIRETEIAYASCALAKEDFDLGLSLLDAKNPQDPNLYQRLVAAQRERATRQRLLKTMRLLAVCMGLAIIVIVSTASAWLRQQTMLAQASAEQAILEKQKADSMAIEAKQSERKAITAATAAEESAKVARNAEAKSKQSELEAIDATKKATKAAEEAKLATLAEAQASYTAQIGLSAERIANNAFSGVREVLTKYQIDNANFCHWEWGHLKSLCELQYDELDTGSRIESIAILENKHLLLAGTAHGFVLGYRSVAGDGKFEKQKVLELQHGDRPLRAVAISPNGQYLAAGDDDGIIKLWKINFDGAKFEVNAPVVFKHDDSVTSLSFSPESDLLLSSSADKTARLWNVPTGKEMQKLLEHGAALWCSCFSADGSRIATAGETGKVVLWIWNPSVGKYISPPDNKSRGYRFQEHKQPVYALAFSPDGNSIASAGREKDILLWKVDELKGVDFVSINRILNEKLDRDVSEAAIKRAESTFRGQRLVGHSAEVRSLRFSHDGTQLLSAGNDNTVRLWQLKKESFEDSRSQSAELSPQQTFRGHGGWVRACAFSSNDRFAVSGGYDKQIKIWDTKNYEEVRTLAKSQGSQGHTDAVLSAAFSPDGKRVVTSGRDRQAIIWDSVSGRIVKALEEGEDANPPKKPTHHDGFVVADLKEGHNFLVTSGLFFPLGDRRILTSAGDDTVRIWDSVSGGQLQKFDGTGSSGTVAITDDGEWMLTGSRRREAILWRSKDNKPYGVLTGTQQDVASVAISHGRINKELLLYTGGAQGNGKLWRWDPETQSKPLQAPLNLVAHEPGYSISGAKFLPDDLQLLTCSHDRTVVRWDANTGKKISTLRHAGGIRSMDISADGQKLVTLVALPLIGSRDLTKYRLYVWDLKNEAERHFDLPPAAKRMSLHSIAMTGDGRSAIVSSTDEQGSKLYRWDFEDNSFQPLWPETAISGTIWAAVCSPDNQSVLTVGGNQSRLFHFASGEQKQSFHPHGSITSANYSPKGDLIATAGQEGDVKLWEANEQSKEFGKVRLKISQAHGGNAINTVVFSPVEFEGKIRILTAAEDGHATVWNILNDAAEKVVSFPAAENKRNVRSATFSPDGNFVLTAADDGTARLWDLRTAKEVARMNHEQDGTPTPVLCANFSANGRWIITGSDDNWARIWDVAQPDHTQLVAKLIGHSAAVTSVSFSPDSSRVLTGSRDGIAKLWNTENPLDPKMVREVLSLKRHAAELTSVQFSRDERNILTSSRDGTAIVWPSSEVRRGEVAGAQVSK